MSKHGVKIDGKWKDIYFRNKQTEQNSVWGPSNHYSLYVGEEFWGTVWDIHGSWTAVAWTIGDMNLVDGFKRRFDAAMYIIKYMRAENR